MKNQKNDNLNMLEAIVQNTEMGKNTLDQLVPMAEDEQFKAELLRQRNIYRQLNQEAHAAIGTPIRRTAAPSWRCGCPRREIAPNRCVSTHTTGNPP